MFLYITMTQSSAVVTTEDGGRQNMFAKEPQVEVMHTKYHMDADADAHGFCMQKEFVKDLVQYKEENMY